LPAPDPKAPELRRAAAVYLGTAIAGLQGRYLGSGFGAHGEGEAVLTESALAFRRAGGEGFALPLAVVENAELVSAGAPSPGSLVLKVFWSRGPAKLQTLLAVGDTREAEAWRRELQLRGGLSKWPPLPLRVVP
jgi:hypothetical protein